MSVSHPIAYIIEGQELKLSIALVETEKLILHEQVIPASLEKLRNNIKTEKILQAPVIVDTNSLVILDGMHRVTALKSLGCRYTPVCLVDYDSQEIKLDRWCRTFRGSISIDDIIAQAQRLGVVATLCEDENYDESKILIVADGTSYQLIPPLHDIEYEFSIVSKIEAWAINNGVKVGHETYQDAVSHLKQGKLSIILCPPKVNKNQVIEVTQKGKVFTPKATRHMIPARPMGLNIPLSILQDPNITVEEANELLSQHLNRKKLKRIPPGEIIYNRRYEEEVFIFLD